MRGRDQSEYRDAGRRPIILALLLSLVVHLAGLAILKVPAGGAVPPDTEPIEVALLPDQGRAPSTPPDALPPRQMVAPPDQINDRPPERTRFESDRDNTVLEEMVRSGVPNRQPVAPQPRLAAPRHPAAGEAGRDRAHADDAARDSRTERPATDAAASEEQVRRPTAPSDAPGRHHGAPALEDLFASTDELVRAQRRASERAERRAAQNAKGGPAGRPAGEGGEGSSSKRRIALAVPPIAPEWSLSGPRGTLDHLPDIQRGDVTLLNTKANVFAPFVRRVGERVFQHLIIRQRSLELKQILSAHAPVRIRVLLDRQGKLSSVAVEERSGSANMDDTLSDALHTAAFDNNPPPSAANAEGNYEFLFQAQLRAFTPGEGGLPGRIESRLSVGLL